MILGEQVDIEKELRSKVRSASEDTSMSAASVCQVEKARARKWVPRPCHGGAFDWEMISWILESLYGNPRHGNPKNPLDCLVFLMLTRKTPIQVGQGILRKLKSKFPVWDDLLREPDYKLIRILQGSGLEKTRAKDIRSTLRRIKAKFGELSLGSLEHWTNTACENFLVSLPGVGTKTARCVMMYTLGRKVFPADAHCIRVLSRMGVILRSRDHRKDQEELAKLVPGLLAYKLHVNLVAHGQKVCVPGSPKCYICSVRKFCKFWRIPLIEVNNSKQKPTVIDLFCGAGGTSLGLIRAGYRVIAAVDSDTWACLTFRLNHPQVDPRKIICKDIQNVSPREVRGRNKVIDLLVGGPPCQGFSMIGARIRGNNGDNKFIDDPRNELYKEFVRMVREISPRVVIMENVPGLFSLKGGYYRKQILTDLNHLYMTKATILNAHAFGVPQHRLRALFIGASREHFGSQAKPIVQNILDRIATTNVVGPDLKSAIRDLPPLQQDDGAEVCRRMATRGRPTDYATKMRAENEQIIFNHVSRPLNARDQLLYALLKPGEEGHDAVKKYDARHLMVYRDDIFHDKYRRLVYERPSPTIMAHMAKDGHMFIHPDHSQTRSMTVREAARIQSFPDEFIFYGPRTYQFQHVGNAVPPLCAEALGNIVRQAVSECGFSW